ncbi:MAG: hypothetical protein AMXMBFR6_21050 [Betaproteobacteria bacterium]|jgi:homoserine kinase type II|nr:homoserine kinase [Rhodocyclaceae bacterium]MCG3186029.1 Homoserine kinase [Rhodocyclaceae bacterium]
MSVYTQVSAEALARFLAGYELGDAVALEPIASGVENSNYFLTTSRGRFVLTLFERLGPKELEFYLGLMSHLRARGLPCPQPLVAHDGLLLHELAGRPAAIVTRLEGKSIELPTVAHCRAVGGLLARLHRAAADYPVTIANPRAAAWWRQTAAWVGPSLPADEHALLEDELVFQQAHRARALPQGVIHADLFRDNVLFVPDSSRVRLAGVLDFYFAGRDRLLMDLAIAANDWCLAADDAGHLDSERTRALLAGYHGERALTAAEARAWPVFLRAAALRFWLSRLADRLRPRAGVRVLQKDPAQFRDLLRAHRREGAPPWLGDT